VSRREWLIALAARHTLPALPLREYAVNGGPPAGPDSGKDFARPGIYVGQIPQGH
jgi:hypothetical protein